MKHSLSLFGIMEDGNTISLFSLEVEGISKEQFETPFVHAVQSQNLFIFNYNDRLFLLDTSMYKAYKVIRKEV